MGRKQRGFAAAEEQVEGETVNAELKREVLEREREEAGSERRWMRGGRSVRERREQGEVSEMEKMGGSAEWKEWQSEVSRGFTPTRPRALPRGGHCPGTAKKPRF